MNKSGNRTVPPREGGARRSPFHEETSVPSTREINPPCLSLSLSLSRLLIRPSNTAPTLPNGTGPLCLPISFSARRITESLLLSLDRDSLSTRETFLSSSKKETEITRVEGGGGIRDKITESPKLPRNDSFSNIGVLRRDRETIRDRESVSESANDSSSSSRAIG